MLTVDFLISRKACTTCTLSIICYPTIITYYFNHSEFQMITSLLTAVTRWGLRGGGCLRLHAANSLRSFKIILDVNPSAHEGLLLQTTMQ